MLLSFVDHLEKQIFVTFEGSMLIDYHPNKNSLVFFRANNKVSHFILRIEIHTLLLL